MNNAEEFTIREAAEYLGYAYNTMNAARHTGKLGGGEAPKFFKRRGLIVYKKSSCDAWLKTEDSPEATRANQITLYPFENDNSNDIAMRQI